MKKWLRVLALTLLAWGTAIPCYAQASASSYRITGVVVSSRDGTPVVRCRVSARLVDEGQVASLRSAYAGGGPIRITPQVRAGGAGGGREGTRGGAPPPNPETVSDSSGHFTLELPKPGAWQLTAAARGFRSQNFDEQDGFYAAVVLTAAAPTYQLIYRLSPEAYLSGIVIDEAGDAVTGAQVTLLRLPAPVPGGSPIAVQPRQVGFAQTDDRGHYEIAGLAAGEYKLRVQAQPWYAQAARVSFNNDGTTASPDPSLDMIYPATWYPGTDTEADAQTLRLAAGEEREADLRLAAMPAVHLRIPLPPTPAVQVTPGERQRPPQQRPATITRISGDLFNMGGLNAAGIVGNQWDFGGLSPGVYDVRLPGADGRSEGAVQRIEVRAGSQTVITLDSAAPTVKVTVNSDRALPGDIEFLDHKTGARVATTGGPRRGFRFDGNGDDAEDDDTPHPRTVMLSPGEYEVNLLGGTDYLTGISATGARAVGRLVTITEAATLTLHTASVRAQVEGVASSAGKPAEGAMVLLVPATLGQPDDLRTVLRDEANTDGSFRLAGVIPGLYILAAIDHGWSVDWHDPATLAKYLLHGVPVDLTKATRARESIEVAQP